MKIQIIQTHEYDVSDYRTCQNPLCEHLEGYNIVFKDRYTCSLFEEKVQAERLCNGGTVIWKCNDCLKACGLPVWKPLDIYGDHFAIEGFIRDIEAGGIMDDDGMGYYATATKESNIAVDFYVDSIRATMKKYPEITHVTWYNK